MSVGDTDNSNHQPHCEHYHGLPDPDDEDGDDTDSHVPDPDYPDEAEDGDEEEAPPAATNRGTSGSLQRNYHPSLMWSSMGLRRRH